MQDKNAAVPLPPSEKTIRAMIKAVVPPLALIAFNIDAEGQVAFSGLMSTRDDLMRAVVTVGNIAGVSYVSFDNVTVLLKTPATSVIHVVGDNERLWQIARECRLSVQEIVDANKGIISDPDRVPSGLTIFLPIAPEGE